MEYAEVGIEKLPDLIAENYLDSVLKIWDKSSIDMSSI